MEELYRPHKRNMATRFCPCFFHYGYVTDFRYYLKHRQDGGFKSEVQHLKSRKVAR